jgi:hypothetical protein
MEGGPSTYQAKKYSIEEQTARNDIKEVASPVRKQGVVVRSVKGWKTRRRGRTKQVSSANNSRDQQAAIYRVEDDEETGSTKYVNSRRNIVS